MKHQRLTYLACATSIAATLALVVVLPAAQAAPGLSETDTGTQEALIVSDSGLDASTILEDRAAIGNLSDASAIAESLIEARLDTRLSDAPQGHALSDASVPTAEAAIDTQGTDVSVLRALPSPSMNTQVPGLSEAELLRYKRQMLRKDI